MVDTRRPHRMTHRIGCAGHHIDAFAACRTGLVMVHMAECARFNHWLGQLFDDS